MSDVVRIDPHAELEPDPEHEGHRFNEQFRGADPALSVGIWSAEEGSTHIDSYPVDEVCFVLDGTITVTSSDGTVNRFERGDAFAMRRGASLLWQQSEGARKVFVILEPQ
jgi:uncharacterized cupin superfamily protein